MYCTRANKQIVYKKKKEILVIVEHISKETSWKASNKKNEAKITKKTVWVQDIKGILYYIDDTGNVYEPQDIIKNKVNPKIIARYEKNGETYKILRIKVIKIN